ncbi:Protein of unknown function [Pyronema omphalodes CBS 100304]|uniref:Uncharacterized protein n=1 Tax=Pyronema omphalodes (strain CBS 100304) TaxID=1076935 RepID=U4LQI8_PYROM|nr:Protein of unknown function [Pyronema omphalodes CBS 100304]
MMLGCQLNLINSAFLGYPFYMVLLQLRNCCSLNDSFLAFPEGVVSSTWSTTFHYFFASSFQTSTHIFSQNSLNMSEDATLGLLGHKQ